MAVRLGLDASQTHASCAVSTDLGIVAALFMEKPIENFPALIRNTLSQASVSLDSLDEIVVCIGPGSQTGVRSAVVTGNALALALGKPITGVLSIDAAAALSPVNGGSSIAVSAGRSRWYVGNYHWEQTTLCRSGELQLMDGLPEHSFATFNNPAIGAEGPQLCAYGILVVAEQQRQLIEQSLLSEVLPYEKEG